MGTTDQDQALIDPALHAEDQAYKSSLGGIYPSQSQTQGRTAAGRLEDEVHGERGHGQAPSIASGPVPAKKKRGSTAAGLEDDGRKKSRQSRMSRP